MKNFLKKWRELLTLIVFFLTAGSFVYFLLMPIYNNIVSRRDQIQEELASQELQEKKLSEIPKIKQQYDWLKNEENKLNVLLKKEDAVVLIEKLEKIAENTNNEIKIEVVENKQPDKKTTAAVATQDDVESPKTNTGIKAVKPKEEDKTILGNLPSKDYLEMKIILTGDYNSILRFLKNLEKMEYYNDVISFQFKLKNDLKIGSSFQSGVTPFSSSVETGSTADIEGSTDTGKKIEANFDTLFYLSK
jgi:F0F1-type ATP synthase membrane subunit b/b'